MASLAGKKIISTRPLAEDDKIKHLLKSCGAHVIDFPMVKTGCIQDTGEILPVLKKMEKFDWIVFTSKNGVSCLCRLLQRNGIPTETLGTKKIAVIGKATENEARKLIGCPALVSEGKNAADLLEEVSKLAKPTDHFLLPLGELADNKLESGLQKFCMATRINVYQTTGIEYNDHPVIEEIIRNDYDLILFTSPSGFRSFHKIIAQYNISRIAAACIGTTTEAEMLKFGFAPVIVSPKPDAESFVKEIERYLALN
ncbi:MAG TPA: uroporphyrinogen-III synthase [Paludibacter sp.]|nr:uroporphyrinogen-III synthase [Paludibacter sp.]